MKILRRWKFLVMYGTFEIFFTPFTIFLLALSIRDDLIAFKPIALCMTVSV